MNISISTHPSVCAVQALCHIIRLQENYETQSRLRLAKQCTWNRSTRFGSGNKAKNDRDLIIIVFFHHYCCLVRSIFSEVCARFSRIWEKNIFFSRLYSNFLLGNIVDIISRSGIFCFSFLIDSSFFFGVNVYGYWMCP